MFNLTKNTEALKTIFDPVKNARALGLIFLVLGIIGLPVDALDLIRAVSLISVISFLLSAIMLVVAFGLFKTKAWAVYAFGAMIILDIINATYSFMTTGEVEKVYIFSAAVTAIIFIWFYSAIKRFNK